MSEIVNPAYETEAFVIDSDQKADWALRKIAEAENDSKKWVEYYQAQIEIIKAQTAESTANLKAMLQHYFDTVPHKTTKTTESYPLPSGKLVFKAQAPEYERDEEKVIEWLKKTNGTEFIKVKESLDWAGLKKTVTVLEDKVITEDGEVIPGIKAIPRDPVFTVEIKEGK